MDGSMVDAGLAGARSLLQVDTGPTLSSIKAEVDGLVGGLNTFFLLICGFMVFFMQLGFAMLCAGLVRHKNSNNIMLKNVLDAAVGSICWYVLGYGFAYGAGPNNERRNAFIGSHDFGLTLTTQANWQGAVSGGYAAYFFQWAFAATAATIVSGAVAERCTFIAYLSYSIYMASFVYPVVVHAVWDVHGWLSAFSDGKNTSTDLGWTEGAAILNTGAIDFAGSGVVHMTGGVAALVGAWMLGPRLGRFRDGKVADTMMGSSTVLVVLGTLILWFGWYGFNPGSQLAIATRAAYPIVARCAVTTTLSAGAGGVTALLFRFWRSGCFEVVYTCNGVLAGLVGVTAGCSTIEPWAALICGVGAALTFYGAELALLTLQIDDCVGAFPVHGAAGIYGVLFVGFFAKDGYVAEVYGYAVERRRYGWFYGGHGQLMLNQFIEVIFIILWVGANMAALFGLLKVTGRLRVPAEMEHAGLDVSVHGSKHGNAQGGAFVDLSVEPNGVQPTQVKPKAEEDEV